MNYLMVGILVLIANIGLSKADDASSSSEYAKLSLEFQNIVQCVVYADTPRNKNKLRNLSPKAITVGREFVSAAIDQKIENSDWSNYVPMEYRLRIQGPTADFVVGRLWESTKSQTLAAIFKNCEACKSDQKLLHIKMNLSFDQYRCGAID